MGGQQGKPINIQTEKDRISAQIRWSEIEQEPYSTCWIISANKNSARLFYLLIYRFVNIINWYTALLHTFVFTWVKERS